MRKRAIVGLCLALATAGCSGTVAGRGTADVPVSVSANLGPQRITLQLHSGQHLSAVTTNPNLECATSSLNVLEGDQPVAVVQLVPLSCPGRGKPAINGNLSAFATHDDVVGQPGLGEKPVKAGRLATFTEKYTECTNSCRIFHLKVAAVFLDHPTDASRPAINIIQEPRTSGSDIDPATLAAQLTN
jgi:hypothetical protein